MSWIWSKKKTLKPPLVSETKATYINKATQTEEHHPEVLPAYYPTRKSTDAAKKFKLRGLGLLDEGPSGLNSIRIPSGASAEIEKQLKSSALQQGAKPAKDSIAGWLDGVGEGLLSKHAKSRAFRHLSIPVIFEKDEDTNGLPSPIPPRSPARFSSSSSLRSKIEAPQQPKASSTYPPTDSN